MTSGGLGSTWNTDGMGTQRGRADSWPAARENGWGLARVLSDGTVERIPLFDRATVGCSGDRAGVVSVSDGGTGAGARFTVRADGVYVESLNEECIVRVEGVPARTLSVADGDVVRMGEVIALFVEHHLEAYQGPYELIDGELLFGPRQRPWLARARSLIASRESVLLTGGVSVGKWSLARHLAREVADPGSIREFDGAQPSHDIDWGAVPLDQTKVCLVRHLDKMTRAAQNELARLVRRSRDGMLIATLDGELADALTDGLIPPAVAGMIAGHEVVVPGLDERREDLAPMTSLLAQRMGIAETAITSEVLEAILRGGWPGGIEELRRVLWTCLAEPSDDGLKRLVGSVARAAPRTPLSLQDVDEDLARSRLRYALDHASGTVATAARELRMSRQSLYRELRRLGLTSPHHGEANSGTVS